MNNRPWKILLVEDDEDDYILTRSMLDEARQGEYLLNWISTYHDALQEISKESLDAILVDYRLGADNGLELVREAIAMNCKVPIIVLTGQGSYDVDLEAMKVGAMDYLSKEEVTPALLERTIRYAIERRQSKEALQRAHDELESRVKERTQELRRANEDLRAEIAERLRAETAVRESEARFRKLAESTSTAIFIVQDMRIRYANQAAKNITGYMPEELQQKSFWEIAHPTYQNVLRQYGLANLPRYELKLLTKDNRERWVDVTAGGFEYQGAPAMVVTAFDITERDLAEQELLKAKNELEARVEERTTELRQTNDQLENTNQQLQHELVERQRAAAEIIKNIAQIEVQRRLIQYREMERLLIAQDLHDGTLQELIAMSFSLGDLVQTVLKRLPESEAVDTSTRQWLDKLKELQGNLNDQIGALRAFCSELRPPTLAPFGLEKAIESHIDSFRDKNAGMIIHTDLEADGQRLPEQGRLVLFRIYQELLNNIIRHSKASEIWIRFSMNDENAILQIKDNGQGFAVPTEWVELARQGHLGLVGVQERATAVGGTVKIESTPGKGTLVRVTIPINQEE